MRRTCRPRNSVAYATRTCDRDDVVNTGAVPVHVVHLVISCSLRQHDTSSSNHDGWRNSIAWKVLFQLPRTAPRWLRSMRNVKDMSEEKEGVIKPENLGEGGKGVEEQEVGGRDQALILCWNCGAKKLDPQQLGVVHLKVPPILWTGKAQISEKGLQACLPPIAPTTRTSARKRSIFCSAAGVRSSGSPRNSVLPPIPCGPGVSGLVVLGGWLAGKQLQGWTAFFLVTTVTTSVTGFFFPFRGFTPAYGVGVISLFVLAAAIYALYLRSALRSLEQGIGYQRPHCSLPEFFRPGRTALPKNSCLEGACANPN